MIQDSARQEEGNEERDGVRDVVMPASMLPVVPAIIAAGGEASCPVWEGTSRGSMIGSYSLPKHDSEHSKSKSTGRNRAFKVVHASDTVRITTA
jgi:hypothetical protein